MSNEEKKIRVLIADDHQVMLDGLQSLLKNESDIRVVAEANNGVEVMAKLNEMPVDVAVLDIRMPEMDGYEVILEIQKKYPEVKVLILSFHKDELNIGKVIRENISGYIIKERGSAEIVKAIREIAAGNTYYDKEVQSVMAKIIKNRHAGPHKTINLSEKETAVLHFLAEDMTSKEIGEKLFIAPSTVETHKRNAAEKLGLKTGQLMKYAIEHGYNAKAHKGKK